jgi:hypothetical protein
MNLLTTEYTEAEALAYLEGQQARRDGLCYFDSPHMKARPRDLYLICAWGEGWLSEDAIQI